MNAPLRRTPALERLLGRLRRRLVAAVWLHGVGTALAAVVAWSLFAFAADYWLRVPGPVRVAHGLVLLGVAGFFLWRDLLRPLRRLPDRAGLAHLVERRHGGLDELLVTAVDLQAAPGEPAEDADDATLRRELTERVLAEAEARASALSAQGVLAESGPRARLGGGAVLAGLAVLGAALNPTLTRIFVDHLLGGSTPWPQRTYLAVEIPLSEAAGRVRVEGERVQVRIARGTDVPVVVRSSGVHPSEVALRFDDGKHRTLSPSGRGVYRTSLRAPQRSLAFHATGGDDSDGLPRVEVEVLQPPDVEGVAISVEPPPWTGLAASVAFNRDVEVVAGSHLAIHVLPTPRDATGVVRLLPDDEALALVPAPFPRDTDDDVRVEQGLVFELDATESFGYRFELVDATGLRNPDPGLFRVGVLADRPPEVRLLAPGRTEHETVAGGAIPLRARADDDFGLTGLGFEVRAREAARPAAGADAPVGDLLAERALERVELPADDGVRPWLGAARIEVDELLAPAGPADSLAAAEGDAAPALDRRFEVVVHATDNHEPDPQVGRAPPLTVRIISADELLRRMKERLARARLDATRLADLQREKEARVLEVLDALPESGPVETGDSLAMHAAAVGQRRVHSDAEILSRDLARAAQDVLYARLDDKAEPLLAFLDARAAESTEVGFQPGVWRAVTEAYARGELGAPAFAGNLVELVEQSLAISGETALEAAAALDRAQKAGDAAGAALALAEAHELQIATLRRVERLLESLAEWDNFQNVLTLTRDILQRQRALRDRTRSYAKESER